MSDALQRVTKKVDSGPRAETPQDPKPDTHDLVSRLDEADLGAFARGILSFFSSQAFGTLAKREVDLLVFHLLSKSSGLKELTTYEWANLLRISEGRVRALRSDAALRFEVVNHKEALKAIARKFNSPSHTAIEYSKGLERVRILLDEPTLQREFEYAVRRMGRIPDYSFNRNVLDVPVTTFIGVFLRNFPDEEPGFKVAFERIMEGDPELKLFLEGTKSLSEKFEAAWSKHAGKRGALTEIVKSVAATLAIL